MKSESWFFFLKDPFSEPYFKQAEHTPIIQHKFQYILLIYLFINTFYFPYIYTEVFQVVRISPR